MFSVKQITVNAENDGVFTCSDRCSNRSAHLVAPIVAPTVASCNRRATGRADERVVYTPYYTMPSSEVTPTDLGDAVCLCIDEFDRKCCQVDCYTLVDCKLAYSQQCTSAPVECANGNTRLSAPISLLPALQFVEPRCSRWLNLLKYPSVAT